MSAESHHFYEMSRPKRWLFGGVAWQRKCKQQRTMPQPGDATALPSVADLPIAVEVRVAERMMTLGQILNMNRGFVLPLEKPAGSSLDLFVGDVRVASAEVLVVDESVAVRVTELMLDE